MLSLWSSSTVTLKYKGWDQCLTLCHAKAILSEYRLKCAWIIQGCSQDFKIERHFVWLPLCLHVCFNIFQAKLWSKFCTRHFGVSQYMKCWIVFLTKALREVQIAILLSHHLLLEVRSEGQWGLFELWENRHLTGTFRAYTSGWMLLVGAAFALACGIRGCQGGRVAFSGHPCYSMASTGGSRQGLNCSLSKWRR